MKHMANRINIIYRLALVLFYYAIVLALTSCQTERKATRFMSEHPNVLAKICDETFPVIPSVDTIITFDSSLLQQYNKEFEGLYFIVDSLLSRGPLVYYDTQRVAIKESIKKTQNALPKPIRTTIKKTEESTAKLQLCKGQIEALQELITERERDYELNIQGFENELNERDQTILKQQGKIDSWRKWAIRFFLLWVVAMLYLLRKPILKLII